MMTTIFGKQIRTTNAQPDELISLWAAMNPAQLSGDIYAVYSNYESDFNGAYDFLIGTTTTTGDHCITIPPQQYEVIDVEPATPEAVYQAWQKIWASDRTRAYAVDFELYEANGAIKIFLSI
ncbi:GyrI-like domain-containing protein [Kurthia huakuii]|uniref:GyrI-like domain-containing protein n=1 Tax=Kurthia huakuii TaxID=1421019 RepID=UPI0004B38595|nr:effector binding domain-containing protein [Kurthia huakuii]MBM7701131.1 putative transcriptional regulator YdeE [Kurthia huakuii]